MRNLPRFALVPLAALISALPLVALPSPARADTASDCQATFASGTQGSLVYTTDPGIRLAFTGQTVSLSAQWDPSAWDTLSQAAACVRLDENVFDSALGTVAAAPANGGSFTHSFTIPEVAQGTRLCTRISLTGDPAGEATEAAWVSKMHCFEVDHEVEEQIPPDDTAPPTQPPSTTTSTAPPAGPVTPQGTPGGDTPADSAPPVSSEGGDSPVGTPFDNADATSGGSGAPVPGGPPTPEMMPLLPATGYASLGLLHQGVALLFTGLSLLVLGGRSRRRRRTSA